MSSPTPSRSLSPCVAMPAGRRSSVRPGRSTCRRSYRPVLGFIEDSVVQVVPPQPTRIFHPKIWVLRFEDAAGEMRHRFLCLSRNLTMDRSWDTVLQMEQSTQGGGADPAPIADFLLDLPLLTPVVDADRQALVESLATTLRGTRLEVPQPFRTAEFWPMGTSSGREWPFPAESTASRGGHPVPGRRVRQADAARHTGHDSSPGRRRSTDSEDGPFPRRPARGFSNVPPETDDPGREDPRQPPRGHHAACTPRPSSGMPTGRVTRSPGRRTAQVPRSAATSSSAS